MGDRPSWRDMDRKRDKSSHRREERGAGGRAPRVETATAAYKRSLNALFDGGADLPAHLRERLGEEGAANNPRTEKLRAVRNSTGRALVKALDAFLAEFDMPDEDLDFLGKALEHPKDAVLLEALGKLEAYVASGQQVARKTLMLSKLEEVALSSFDPRVQRKAELLAERLR